MKKGIYLLFITVKKDIKVKVGSLGEIKIKKGLYVYVGSAQNNLEQRIKRHTLKEKKLFWHIDYITSHPYVEIIGAILINGPKSLEPNIACKLSQKFPHIKKFGATDDNACNSHLFKII
ncbi:MULTISPECIES: GIY-YIG nuclease family protein [Thermosipho]|uniref:Endonuclease n=1 Tax=Thermosipho affectus TaxID=660294 RepID=A0ABX3IJQ6_9BACT|nr:MULTISPECIES: GIY-YIG nuclease family protein [Thermosipho]MBT1247744.1 endonuclease [Thermosipho sp. 1244]ONN27412.1 endonuclease [Thermosipho affectus]OOC46968.1 endonuclease [Thermosipho sp. 1223]